VKVSTESFEINLTLREQDVTALKGIHGAEWDSRDSIRAGECLGCPVFWSVAESGLCLLIGNDDETWGVGSTLPIASIQNLLAELDSASGKRTN
jgi:hypothetical protein